MENTKTEMDLLELFLVDAIFTLIFVFVLFLAVFSPGHSLMALNFPLVFGGVTLPFAGLFGKWMAFLRYHENDKLAARLNMDPDSSGWIFFDLGVNGYTWMFRVISALTVIFAVYHLIERIIR